MAQESRRSVSSSSSLEFAPRFSEDTDEGARNRMPTLPLHLLHGDRDGGSTPDMGHQSSSHSSCAASSVMSCSIAPSVAPSDIGSCAFREAPLVLRSAQLPAVPSCFKCKLRQEVIEDPVRLPDGSLCERKSAAALHPKFELLADPVFAEAINSYFELRKESERQRAEWHKWVGERNKRAQEKLSQRQRQILALRMALEKSRKREKQLEERLLADRAGSAATSSTASLPGETTPEAEPSSAPLGDEAAPPMWRSGPAPRSEAPVTSRASERRRSTWSFLSGRA